MRYVAAAYIFEVQTRRPRVREIRREKSARTRRRPRWSNCISLRLFFPFQRIWNKRLALSFVGNCAILKSGVEPINHRAWVRSSSTEKSEEKKKKIDDDDSEHLSKTMAKFEKNAK